MYQTKQAFTLIELLVVVLIIGILAAVAIPQYQFAVDKSHVMPYVQRVQEIIRAEQVYFLHEGEYTPHLSSLDIELTKICPATTGVAKDNELKDCPGGIGINVSGVSPTVAGTRIAVLYCRRESCYSSVTDKHMSLNFKLTDGSFDSCEGYTVRGRKLCAFFKGLYQ